MCWQFSVVLDPARPILKPPHLFACFHSNTFNLRARRFARLARSAYPAMLCQVAVLPISESQSQENPTRQAGRRRTFTGSLPVMAAAYQP